MATAPPCCSLSEGYLGLPHAVGAAISQEDSYIERATEVVNMRLQDRVTGEKGPVTELELGR